MANVAKKDTVIDIPVITKGRISFCVLGVSPLICNRMSEKVMRELLMPKGKKTSVEKASSLKHDPIEEFRASPYTARDGEGETHLKALAAWFKGAAKSAALDIPGANKTQIGRLVHVEGERLDLYGVPQILCAVTRSADINKTPDVRSRAILPEWACRITVNFQVPNLREQSVANLIAAAGVTQGIGDWRTGKGSGTYGEFRLVPNDDADFQRIIKTGGREAQLAALENPISYDQETDDLLAWFGVESKRRGFKAVG